jgi:hypothetical protein
MRKGRCCLCREEEEEEDQQEAALRTLLKCSEMRKWGGTIFE